LGVSKASAGASQHFGRSGSPITGLRFTAHIFPEEQPKAGRAQVSLSTFLYLRKEVKTMKYETPQLTALTAVTAIQEPVGKLTPPNMEQHGIYETPAYSDWE
jgi:hypothetical protein